MKPKSQRRGKRGEEKLRKLMVSVNNYVQSQGGHEDTEHYDHRGKFVKKKSRKQLRKEKRKMKKHTRSLLTGNTPACTEPDPPKNTRNPRSGAQTARATGGRVRQADEPQRKVHFDETSRPQRKKSNLDISRKRALMEANVVEDMEIKKLEKRLGLNKRRNRQSLPQSFVNDGLDYILGFLESGATATGLYDSGDEETGAAMATTTMEQLHELSDTEEEEGDEPSEEEGSVHAGPEKRVDMSEEENETEQQDSDINAEEDESEEEEGVGSEGRPCRDGSQDTEQPSAKYVPPAVRGVAANKREIELDRLRRSLKGLINRLSEANMGSISGQVEEMYMSYSRKDMNDTLTELLLAACVTPSLTPDRLLMEHMLLLSVMHHTVGLEVGAHFLETVVRRFNDTHHQDSGAGRECDNLLCLVAHLYTFQVVHSGLVLDLLKRLLASFTARDLELILLLLRNVGFTLRKDDPLALKDLITQAQRQASSEAPRFHDQTRVRFMLEIMLALKNNDMRKIPGYNPEPAERLKKLQRTLVRATHH